MMFALWVAGTGAAISVAASLLVAITLMPGMPKLPIPAAARARSWELAAALPFFVALVAVVAAMLPAIFGADHCMVHGEHHPHLCPLHSDRMPAPWLTLAAVVVLGRFGAGVARAVRRSIRRGELLSQLHPREGSDVLEIDAPMAFVVGLARPRVYVSAGLLRAATAGEIDLDVVLAHERGHAASRHPLRRLLASLVLCFHLPGIARRIERRIALAHETSADRDAASAVGDPLRVAEALVGAARLAKSSPTWALSITGGDVEARVRELLAPNATRGRDVPFCLAIVIAALGASALLESSLVHHSVETILGWLHA
jgi:Zn-dependent protease with chaperone function